MKQIWAFFWMAVIIVIIGSFWPSNTRSEAIQSITQGHAADWIMGAFCLLWLFVILKLPWDLYFKAQLANFELQRSQERGIPIVAGREAYIRGLRTKLGWLAVGLHLVSALVVAAIPYFAKGSVSGSVGYAFAGFYLISTLFRPLAAGYAYLAGKLSSITEEARYPREDVVEMRGKLKEQENTIRDLTQRMDQLQTTTAYNNTERENEARITPKHPCHRARVRGHGEPLIRQPRIDSRDSSLRATGGAVCTILAARHNGNHDWRTGHP